MMKFSHNDFRSTQKCNACVVCPVFVEVAMKDGHVGVRDSKQSNSPVLEFTNDEWSTFIEGVKAGEFDI